MLSVAGIYGPAIYKETKVSQLVRTVATIRMLQVKHYIDWHGSVPMLPGMTFTIEPLIVEGRYFVHQIIVTGVSSGVNSEFKIWRDNWTVVSTVGRRSAQYEHTILITEDGHEVIKFFIGS